MILLPNLVVLLCHVQLEVSVPAWVAEPLKLRSYCTGLPPFMSLPTSRFSPHSQAPFKFPGSIHWHSINSRQRIFFFRLTTWTNKCIWPLGLSLSTTHIHPLLTPILAVGLSLLRTSLLSLREINTQASTPPRQESALLAAPTEDILAPLIQVAEKASTYYTFGLAVLVVSWLSSALLIPISPRFLSHSLLLGRSTNTITNHIGPFTTVFKLYRPHLTATPCFQSSTHVFNRS